MIVGTPADITTSLATAVVTDAKCIESGAPIASCRLFDASSRPPFFKSAYYSSNGRSLYLLNREGHLARLDPASGTVEEVTKLWTARHGNDVSITGPTSSPTVAEETRKWAQALTFPVSSDQDRARVSLGRDGVVGIAYRHGKTLQVSVASGTNHVVVPLLYASVALDPPNLSYAQLPSVFEDGRGGLWLFGGGGAITANSQRAASLGNFSDGDYSRRPVTSATSGNLIAVHSEREIQLLTQDTELSLLFRTIERGLTGARTLRHLAVAEDNRRVIAVVQDVSFGVTFSYYWRADSRWHARSWECRSPSAGELQIALSNAGTHEWPLPARLYSRPGVKKLLVFLHGGPSTSSAYDQYWLRIEPFLQAGYDVLTLDPSGSLASPDIAARIMRNGTQSFERDAEFAARYVQSLRRYNQVSLLAESFGGVLAPSLIGHLNVQLDRIALVAPLVRYRLPRERGEPARNVEYAELSETQRFAGAGSNGKPFAQWLADQYGKLEIDDRFIIVQGENDLLSLPEDLPDSPRGRRLIIRNGYHVQATSSQESLAAVGCWLTNRC